MKRTLIGDTSILFIVLSVLAIPIMYLSNWNEIVDGLVMATLATILFVDIAFMVVDIINKRKGKREARITLEK
jgi:hypothetical protein